MIVKENNIRIDKYLVDKLDLSRSKIQSLIKNNKILVNGKSTTSNYMVHIDDEIEVLDDLNFEIDVVPEDIPIDVVYEDDNLLIVNKPSGMVVHPAAGNYSHTLVNALLYRFKLSSIGGDIRPGIVHRIDKDTSGVMVVAKDDKTHELLSDMMKEHKVERCYYALVEGIINHDVGDIDAPIGRDTVDRKKMMVTDVDSKEAFTHFRVLKRFKKSNKTLIECKLSTGRTHQIRVHMSYIGYPIYNDPVYGKSKKTTPFGQFLHSKSIKFTHPITNKEIFLEVDLPVEFQDYLDELERNED